MFTIILHFNSFGSNNGDFTLAATSNTDLLNKLAQIRSALDKQNFFVAKASDGWNLDKATEVWIPVGGIAGLEVVAL